MNKQRLLQLAENPDFVSGIYNYCNRWCERCAFTKRCLLYATEQESPVNSKEGASDMEGVLNHVKESFDLAFELLADTAEQHGIDLNALDEQNTYTKKREEKREIAEEHPVAKAAYSYPTMVKDWFSDHENLFKTTRDSLENDAMLGIGEPEVAAADITNAVEVLQWYEHQIWVKLMRALTGKEEDEEENDSEMAEFPKDSDGSAKVALIGIDDSIEAWELLLHRLADENDSIKNMVGHLSNLRKGIEEEFPQARSFVRPGFDQEV